MKPIDARTEHFMLIDMDGYICLFTSNRLDRDTIPEGLHCYDVRDDGSNGEFAQVQRFVWVNHWGSILCKQAIPLDEEWNCYYPNRDAIYFPYSDLTMEQFQNTPNEELIAPWRPSKAQQPELAERVNEALKRSSAAEKSGEPISKSDPAR